MNRSYNQNKMEAKFVNYYPNPGTEVDTALAAATREGGCYVRAWLHVDGYVEFAQELYIRLCAETEAAPIIDEDGDVVFEGDGWRVCLELNIPSGYLLWWEDGATEAFKKGWYYQPKAWNGGGTTASSWSLCFKTLAEAMEQLDDDLQSIEVV